MDTLTDIRHASRSLLASRGFAVTVVVTLALGLAAVSTIFAVVETVLLRPLNFPRSERIVTVSQNLPALTSGPTVVSVGEFHNWQQSGLFEHAALMGTAEYTLLGTGRSERLFGVSVTPDFFRVFGLQPFLGRGFEAEDATPGHDNVIVLSHQLWMSSFGGDRSVVGKPVRTAEGPLTVIGVMPPRFDFPRLADVRTIMFWVPEQTEFWIPMTITEKELEEDKLNYLVLGRLKDDVTLQRAAEQCRPGAVQAFRQMEIQKPAYRAMIEQAITTLSVYVMPLRTTMSWGIRDSLWMLLAAVGLLLVLVLFNLGNLLLTRNAGRLREFVVREALGATRWQLFRQSFAEQIILVAGAAIIGLVIAAWGVSVIRAVGAARLPRLYELSVDARVMALLFILSLAIAVMFGALPLVVLRNAAIDSVLRSESRSSTGDRRTNRLKSSLMVVQVGVSVVLLVGAGLLIRSFANVMRVDPGFDPHNLLCLSVSLNPKSDQNPEQRVARLHKVLEAFRAIPGVESAAVVNHLPLTGESEIHSTWPVGRESADVAAAEGAEYRAVDASYFSTMRIPLLAGRAFRDDEPAGFAVINHKMASRLWPGEDAVGKQFRDGDNPPVTVVGIVGDVHNGSLEREPRMQFYLPLSANPWWSDQFILRTRIDPAAILPLAQQAVWQIDPEQPVSHPQIMERLLESVSLDRRFETGLLSGFAATALFLATLGLFSMASLSVMQRVREFGIRLALGAEGADLLRLELRRTLTLALAGLGIGVGASLLLARMAAGLLYGVTAWSPAIYGAALLVLLMPAIVAAWFPARRAARVDPAHALRCE